MLRKMIAASLLLCASVCLALGQAKSPVKVTIAIEDADDNVVENPTLILPSNIPVYCYVDLENPKVARIEIRVFAKKVKTLRPNSKFVTLKYSTGKEDGGASFGIKPKGKWKTGVYQIQVFLDGVKVETVEFTVSEEKKSKTSS